MKKRTSRVAAHSRSAAPQAPPEHGVLNELIGYQIRRAQTRLFAHFEERLGSLKITPGQLGLLVLISSNPGISQIALARAVGIERATLGEFIDRFERERLVERRSLVGDRRSYALHLTKRGQEFLDRALPEVLRHEADFTSHLTASERTMLLKLLRKMADRPVGRGGNDQGVGGRK